MTNPEIIIVGTGPAAVSFAVPFANRGYNILFFRPQANPFQNGVETLKTLTIFLLKLD